MAIAVVAAFMTGFATLLLVVPTVFTFAFAIAMLNGRAKQAALRNAGILPIDLPDSVWFSDARAKMLVERLASARAAIQSTVLAGPRGAAFDVSSALDQIPKLEREVVVLASRIEYIARFLDSTSLPGLRMTLARVRERGEGHDDMRGPFSRAADRCQAQVDAVRTLIARAEVLAGQAEEALLTVEGIPARITSLQLRRLEACDSTVEPASAAATSLVETFAALEQASSERTT